MAALCTFGWEPKSVPVTRIHSVEAPEKDTWWAKKTKTSLTGFDFVECFRGWFKPALLPDEHRMRDVRAYADNHLRLIRVWKRAPMISAVETIRRGATNHLSSSTNTKLAAALMSAGFALDEDLPATKSQEPGAGSREQGTYWFAIRQEQKPELQVYLEGWARFAEFSEKYPEHPMCYHRAYAENREKLIQLHRDSIPQILIPHGSRCLLVTPGLPKKYKRQLERMV